MQFVELQLSSKHVHTLYGNYRNYYCEGRSSLKRVQITISHKAAAEVFLVLSCGSVKYLNPWIIKHNNLTFGTG